TQPDPAHKGVVVNAHGPAVIVDFLTHGHIDIAGEAGVDSHFRHDLPAGEIAALLRPQCMQLTLAPVHDHHGLVAAIVGTLHLAQGFQCEVVTRHLHTFAHTHSQRALV